MKKNNEIEAVVETKETSTTKAVKVTPVKKSSADKTTENKKVVHVSLKKKKVNFTPGENMQKLIDNGINPDPNAENPLFYVPKKTVDMNTDDIQLVEKKDARIIIDTYYQSQRRRIGAENQERAVMQGLDDGDFDNDITVDSDIKYPALAYIVDNRINEEKELAKLVDRYVESSNVGRWMKSNIGVGPLIAGCFLAYFDITKAKYAGNFWSYCGYNDSNDPWLSTAQVEYIMKNIVGDNKIDEEIFSKISAYCGRSAKRIAEGAREQIKKGNTYIPGEVTKESLKKYLKKPPFNRNLKTACWKLGQSFMKVKNNPNSKYGSLLKEREMYELTMNEEGAYIQEALKSLGYIFKKDKNLTKEEELALLKKCNEEVENKTFKPRIENKEIRNTYLQGKLPKGHIIARCLRWTVKLFISHMHEAMYLDYYGEEAPVPYTISIAGHTKRIAPEVPYSDFINVPKGYNPHYDA